MMSAQRSRMVLDKSSIDMLIFKYTYTPDHSANPFARTSEPLSLRSGRSSWRNSVATCSPKRRRSFGSRRSRQCFRSIAAISSACAAIPRWYHSAHVVMLLGMLYMFAGASFGLRL